MTGLMDNSLHLPLNPDKQDIRLLTILPGDELSPLSCSLQHISLLTRPAYETISYVWGDSALKTQVHLDGRASLIPASSAAALRCLRSQHHVRKVWIDAICIDQNNQDERAQQVLLMRDVYSNGQTNLIYLGESATAEQEVAEMYKIYNEAREDTMQFSQLTARLFREDWAFKRSQQNLRAEIDWAMIDRLWSNPWFNRVWVMQEAALSANSTCFYGGSKFPLIDLLRSNLWLRHHLQSIPSTWHELQHSPCMQTGYALWGHVDQEYGFHRPQGLRSTRGTTVRQALYTARQLNASEQRDKVYGVIGLMSCAVSSVPKELWPDYRRPVEQVFIDAAHLVLSESADATRHLFEGVSHRTTDLSDGSVWPTWIPRWDRRWSLEKDPLPIARHFNASLGKGSSKHLADAGDPSLLLQSGIIIDVVQSISSTLFWSTDWKDFTAWLREVESLARDVAHDTVVASVLVAGSSPRRMPATAEDLLVWTDMRADIISRKDQILPPGELSPTVEDKERRISSVVEAIRLACRQRRAFTTNGRRVGIGSEVIQPGDLVAIVYGCDKPFVLRKWGENYKNLGQSYVHGIMHGEAVAEHKAQRKDDDNFVLC